MFKILEIEGDSMYPLLKDKEKVVCIKPLLPLSTGDIVVFRHETEGLMIKQLTKVDENGFYVQGTTAYSVDSSIFGYLKKEDILYKMLFKY